MQWVAIPSGTVWLGDDRIPDSAPRHALALAAFSLAKFPVTNAEFAEFIADGGYTRREFWTAMGWKALTARPYHAPAYWTDPRFNSPSQPVVGVTWYEAVAFCSWLSSRHGEPCRLPTEAEWEYAARGQEDARNFPWGEHFELGRGNTAELGLGQTTPVDTFPGGVSPFGVWDLSGNVFEWTASRWGPNWQELEFTYPYRPSDGREELEGSGARVMRGGSWFGPYQEAFSARRSRYLAGSRASNIGFRVARTP